MGSRIEKDFYLGRQSEVMPGFQACAMNSPYAGRLVNISAQGTDISTWYLNHNRRELWLDTDPPQRLSRQIGIGRPALKSSAKTA